MDNDKRTQTGKNGQKLSPNVDNDQLGENNGESNCGCGGNNPGNKGKTAGSNTSR
ncbi:MAG: hypothetical protein N2484_09325 [Clostridia bacterium]|nr:hypothetical protein [Clostridia bacterium]